MDTNPGEGHAHLYIDNVKRARLYGTWFHLEDLEPGKHIIRVTLNANNHSALIAKQRLVEASIRIIQPE
jgi:hypothetical protein